MFLLAAMKGALPFAVKVKSVLSEDTIEGTAAFRCSFTYTSCWPCKKCNEMHPELASESTHKIKAGALDRSSTGWKSRGKQSCSLSAAQINPWGMPQHHHQTSENSYGKNKSHSPVLSDSKGLKVRQWQPFV